jgi:hypothetical protein
MKKPQPNRLGFLWSVQCALGEARTKIRNEQSSEPKGRETQSKIGASLVQVDDARIAQHYSLTIDQPASWFEWHFGIMAR